MIEYSDIQGEARQLFDDMGKYPNGTVSPSIYETARLVAIAPWLTGHDDRLRFLLNIQQSNGTWNDGYDDAYALVPTLSAVDALLSVLSVATTDANNRAVDHPDNGSIVAAIDRGLQALVRMLGGDCGFSDMIASELIIPALVVGINMRLVQLAASEVDTPAAWAGTRLVVPAATDPAKLDALCVALSEPSATVNPKLLHTLEVFGDTSVRLASVHPVSGNVGCSPASTATWLGVPPADADGAAADAMRYLEALALRGRGAVPGVSPISVFEAAWTVTTLLGAGVDVEVPQAIRGTLESALTVRGASVAPGLLCDADTTAVTLLALARLGIQPSLDSLLSFDTGAHFRCWPGERNPSVSANAHVLETLAYYWTHHPESRDTVVGPIERVSRWLVEMQQADGSWIDKWHVSPYYATLVSARALAAAGFFGPIGQAVRWVVKTQRQEGAWGYWQGTEEETAYALQILLAASSESEAAVDGCWPAILAGGRFLRDRAPHQFPPLWHDKDLYAPIMVIRAEVIAALHLVRAQNQPERNYA